MWLVCASGGQNTAMVDTNFLTAWLAVVEHYYKAPAYPAENPVTITGINGDGALLISTVSPLAGFTTSNEAWHFTVLRLSDTAGFLSGTRLMVESITKLTNTTYRLTIRDPLFTALKFPGRDGGAFDVATSASLEPGPLASGKFRILDPLDTLQPITSTAQCEIVGEIGGGVSEYRTGLGGNRTRPTTKGFTQSYDFELRVRVPFIDAVAGANQASPLTNADASYAAAHAARLNAAVATHQLLGWLSSYNQLQTGGENSSVFSKWSATAQNISWEYVLFSTPDDAGNQKSHGSVISFSMTYRQ